MRRILCWLGFHHFKVTDRAFAHGTNPIFVVEKLEALYEKNLSLEVPN